MFDKENTSKNKLKIYNFVNFSTPSGRDTLNEISILIYRLNVIDK